MHLSKYFLARGQKRKVNKDDKLDQIVGMAQTLTNYLGDRQPVPRNANSAFVHYLFEELERMPADVAKEKRKQILLLLLNEK